MQLWNNYKAHTQCGSYLWCVSHPNGKVETIRGLKKWAEDKDVHLPALYQHGKSKGYVVEMLDDRPRHEWEVEYPDGTIEIRETIADLCREYKLNIIKLQHEGHTKGFKARRLYDVRE